MQNTIVLKRVREFKETIGQDLPWEITYMDCKYVNGLVREYRKECLILIKEYKAWKATYAKNRDVRAIVYNGFKGDLLYKNLMQTLKAYREIRRDAKIMVDTYIERL